MSALKKKNLTTDSIKSVRDKIDVIDKTIWQCLQSRAKYVLQIGAIKSKKNHLVYRPEREQEIYQKLLKLHTEKDKLSSKSVQGIFSEIISACRALETSLQVSYLGPEASYTHQAALKQFGSQVSYVSQSNIQAIFESVVSDKVNFGIVPIENSNEGTVNITLDFLQTYDLNIYCEHYMAINLCLLSNEKELKNIKHLYSHVQPFGQCYQWIASHLPHAARHEVASTSEAAAIASEKKNAAAIGSDLNAKRLNIQVIKRHIEDGKENITRFIVLAHQKHLPSTNHDITSLLISLKDKQGALKEVISAFARYGINLTKISSRPAKLKPFDYYFYIDCEGHHHNKRLKKALTVIEKKVFFVKHLGSYPQVQAW